MPRLQTLELYPTEIQGGGNFCTGRKNFPTLRNPQVPNCLKHSLPCKPMLRFRGRKICNKMATESTIISQHLKESAVPNTCPKTMDP